MPTSPDLSSIPAEAPVPAPFISASGVPANAPVTSETKSTMTPIKGFRPGKKDFPALPVFGSPRISERGESAIVPGFSTAIPETGKREPASRPGSNPLSNAGRCIFSITLGTVPGKALFPERCVLNTGRRPAIIPQNPAVPAITAKSFAGIFTPRNSERLPPAFRHESSPKTPAIASSLRIALFTSARASISPIRHFHASETYSASLSSVTSRRPATCACRARRISFSRR
ncbi:MAG: hypothetical protein BWY49_00425 [Candidatus Omnitrophica bacterium ADurb.Bin314]|nr:MAG: hypothetical protein BWY49_00425 [Candidatus Omnitrophica bacterium ADurb.Bin314]